MAFKEVTDLLGQYLSGSKGPSGRAQGALLALALGLGLAKGCEMSTNTSAIAPNLMTISQATYSAAIHSNPLDLRVCDLKVQIIEGLPQLHNNRTFNTSQPFTSGSAFYQWISPSSVDRYNMQDYDRARVGSMSEVPAEQAKEFPQDGSHMQRDNSSKAHLYAWCDSLGYYIMHYVPCVIAIVATVKLALNSEELPQ